MKRFNLIDYRKRSGLTQKEMAAKLNVSAINYINIENGNRDGSFKFWETFHNTFDVDNMWYYMKKEK